MTQLTAVGVAIVGAGIGPLCGGDPATSNGAMSGRRDSFGNLMVGYVMVD